MKATIVGGGIGGLVAARRLLDLRPDASITMIERDTKVGGLLAGGHYGPESVYFDTGTHISQETGVEGVDQFLQSCVPAEDLIVYTPPHGDVSGAVFAGVFQANSHFPDLRGHKALDAISAAVRSHIDAGITTQPMQRTSALADQVRFRFGADYSDKVLLPRLAEIYGVAADELCAFALELPGVTRVIIDELDAWVLRAAGDEVYRAVIGIPDQTRLPATFRHGRRSYYSRRNGSSSFMLGAAENLRADDVSFRLGARIEKIDIDANSLIFSDSSGSVEIDHDVLILATGIMPAAAMLGLDLRSFAFDRPLKHQVFHMVLPEAAKTECYYAYNLDHAGWYRFTNYPAFSGDNADRRLTVEVLGEHAGEPEGIAAEILADLFAKGLLNSVEGVMVGHAVLPSGFPRPTTKNFASLAAVRAAVTENLPSNVMLGGVATGRDAFFQNEVVMAIYNGLPEFLDQNS